MKKNAFQCWTQGDITLVKINEIPEAARKTSNAGPVILAYGEITGHKHCFLSNVDQFFAGEEQFVRVLGGGGTLVHEEHGAIKFKAGDYAIVRQTEYTSAGPRTVQD